MKIEINNRTKFRINLKPVKKVVAVFVRAHKIKAEEISLAFVRGAEMKKLNKTYRKINKTTDILSFGPDGDFLGELVIDYGQIKKQAEESGRSAREELTFILVHGLLHLIGYDDNTESKRKKMIKLGEEFIKKYNL